MATILEGSDTVAFPNKEIVQEKSIFSRLIAALGFVSCQKDSKDIKSTQESSTRSLSVTSSSINRTRSFSTLSHNSQSYDTKSQSSRSSHRSHSSRSQSSRSSPRVYESRSQTLQSPRSQSSKLSSRSHRDETESQSTSFSSRSHSRDRSHSHKDSGGSSKRRFNSTRSGNDLESFLMPMLEMKKTIERRSKTSPREKHQQQYDSFLSRKSTGRTELASVDEETEVTSFSTISNSSGDSSPLTVSQ